MFYCYNKLSYFYKINIIDIMSESNDSYWMVQQDGVKPGTLDKGERFNIEKKAVLD